MERRPSFSSPSPSRREHEAAHPTTHPSRAACSLRSLRGFFNGRFLLAVVVIYTCSHLIHVQVITDETNGNDAAAYPTAGPVTRPSHPDRAPSHVAQGRSYTANTREHRVTLDRRQLSRCLEHRVPTSLVGQTWVLRGAYE
jgi:hypothetical protein